MKKFIKEQWQGILIIVIFLAIIGGFIVLLATNDTYRDRVNRLLEFTAEDETDKVREALGGIDANTHELQEQLDALQDQINELQNPTCTILYGEFIGINSYGDVTYHVILVNGVEIETIGNKDYTYVMNEKVVVLAVGDKFYSTPLRGES